MGLTLSSTVRVVPEKQKGGTAKHPGICESHGLKPLCHLVRHAYCWTPLCCWHLDWMPFADDVEYAGRAHVVHTSGTYYHTQRITPHPSSSVALYATPRIRYRNHRSPARHPSTRGYRLTTPRHPTLSSGLKELHSRRTVASEWLSFSYALVHECMPLKQMPPSETAC